MLTLTTSSGGRGTRSYFEKKTSSYLIDDGAHIKIAGLIYVFHQQFIHVEVHIEIGGWQWSHPFFIGNLKIL